MTHQHHHNVCHGRTSGCCPLSACVAQVPRIDHPAIAGKLTVAGESLDLAHLHRDRHSQDPPNPRDREQLLVERNVPRARQQ